MLEEYLFTVVNNKNNIQPRISDLLFKNPVEKNDISIEFKNSKDVRLRYGLDELIKLGKFLILDFNYTQTIKEYITDYEKGIMPSNIIYINIHGILNDEKNPMIFGFGDELDENYKKIEKSRLNGVLKYIKSINYLKTSNYRKFLDFLELDYFQIFTWGHSCGMTDRTLLNHVFEHNNCVSIKPYYYKRYNEEIDSYSDNYIEIVSNIARNFTDKNKLRDRVVNYQFCEPLIK